MGAFSWQPRWKVVLSSNYGFWIITSVPSPFGDAAEANLISHFPVSSPYRGYRACIFVISQVVSVNNSHIYYLYMHLYIEKYDNVRIEFTIIVVFSMYLSVYNYIIIAFYHWERKSYSMDFMLYLIREERMNRNKITIIN